MTCRLLSAVWRALWKKIKQSVVFNLGNINTSNTEQIFEENSKCVIRFCLRIYLKRLIELQKRFLIAGDSGYPSSKNLVKPYSTAESANDPQKRLFNKRLSGLRTVMSECLFGVWKARFPILRNLQTKFALSQKIVVATAVLFNLARMWEDVDIQGEEEDDDAGDEGVDDDDTEEIVVHDAAIATIRQQGKILRDKFKDEMPPR